MSIVNQIRLTIDGNRLLCRAHEWGCQARELLQREDAGAVARGPDRRDAAPPAPARPRDPQRTGRHDGRRAIDGGRARRPPDPARSRHHRRAPDQRPRPTGDHIRLRSVRRSDPHGPGRHDRGAAGCVRPRRRPRRPPARRGGDHRRRRRGAHGDGTGVRAPRARARRAGCVDRRRGHGPARRRRAVVRRRRRHPAGVGRAGDRRPALDDLRRAHVRRPRRQSARPRSTLSRSGGRGLAAVREGRVGDRLWVRGRRPNHQRRRRPGRRDRAYPGTASRRPLRLRRARMPERRRRGRGDRGSPARAGPAGRAPAATW